MFELHILYVPRLSNFSIRSSCDEDVPSFCPSWKCRQYRPKNFVEGLEVITHQIGAFWNHNIICAFGCGHQCSKTLISNNCMQVSSMQLKISVAALLRLNLPSTPFAMSKKVLYFRYLSKKVEITEDFSDTLTYLFSCKKLWRPRNQFSDEDWPPFWPRTGRDRRPRPRTSRGWGAPSWPSSVQTELESISAFWNITFKVLEVNKAHTGSWSAADR